MNIPKLIERAGERVLTTAQLAEAYGTTAKEIAYNFNGNKKYYTEGKHFYCLTGDALRKFKHDSGNSGIAIPKNVNRYYLWTERGALLHAKSLNTDTAWAVYDFLVENYFRKRKRCRFRQRRSHRNRWSRRKSQSSFFSSASCKPRQRSQKQMHGAHAQKKPSMLCCIQS